LRAFTFVFLSMIESPTFWRMSIILWSQQKLPPAGLLLSASALASPSPPTVRSSNIVEQHTWSSMSLLLHRSFKSGTGVSRAALNSAAKGDVVESYSYMSVTVEAKKQNKARFRFE
jgi:hypothetical protein